MAASIPLFADEAYYLFWSQDLRLGYLDHPPGVAVWMSLGHPRLAGLTLLPAAWWLLADAARRLGVAHWRWLPALLMWTPLGAGAALVATPDAPLVAAWCLVLWAVVAERRIVAGLAFGLCLWSKSTALVALPGLVWVLRGRSVLVLSVASAVYAPHVAWSIANDGLPWTFQAGHRALTGFHLPEALGGQLAVVSPAIFALVAAAWWRPADAVDRRLRALSLPVLLVWLAASCGTRVEANWPALAWPAAAILLLRRDPRLLPHAAGLGAVITIAAMAVLLLWPDGVGPPRESPCLRAQTELELVAARYQEKALLDLSGPPVAYLRAAGHRTSEYDRRGQGSLDGGEAPPRCGFLYLADVDALDGRCDGVERPLRACGRAAVECRCVE